MIQLKQILIYIISISLLRKNTPIPLL